MLQHMTIAAIAVMAIKPISEMNMDECRARLGELALEIATSGQPPTAEQEAEMAALQARMEELVMGELAGRSGEMDAAEAEAARQDDMFTVPDTMPLDAIGEVIAAALPTEFRGEACNADTADTYQNLTTFFAGKGIDSPPTGQSFYRRCGNDDGNNYGFSVDSTQETREFVANITSMTTERRQDEGVELVTLCGQTAYRSRGFQSTTVPLGEVGALFVTDWEGEGRSTDERFATQAAMINEVNCAVLIEALSE